MPRYRFGDCALDTRRRELSHAGHIVKLRPKVFDLLAYLLEHRSRVVSKSELLERLWPDQFVSDATLNACIKLARQATGDNGRSQHIIQTRHRQGYRFVAEVTVLPDADGEAPWNPSPPCPACHQTVQASDAFCRACGTPLQEPCRHCGAPASRLAAFCPACGQNLLQSEALPPPPGERKVVTVLACDLASADSSTDLHAETLHRQRQALLSLVSETIRHYGGTVERQLDAGVLALFGAPVVHEDHALRAALAATRLQQRLRTSSLLREPLPNHRLDVRIGIHTGVMVISWSDGTQQLMATPIGDTTQRAVQLCARAAAGNILISESTRQRIQARAQVVAYAAADASDTDAAFRLLEVRPRHAVLDTAGRPLLSHFVGREHELATLQRLSRRLRHGRGHVVSVVGDAGIGKSRLLYEWLQHVSAEETTSLLGRCVSYGVSTPYLPLLDILKQVCDITATDDRGDIGVKVQRAIQRMGMDLDSSVPYLLRLFDVQDDTGALTRLSGPAIRMRTFEVLRQMCWHASRRRPLVLAIEDAHWIDATSEAWLLSLVDRLAGFPCLLVVTARSGYHPPWMAKSYVTHLTLPPLSDPESRRLLDSLVDPARVSKGVLDRLLQQAEGNPFFLEEFARALGERPRPDTPLGVPETIQAVLAARLDRLPAVEKRLLQLAAVIGHEIPLSLLRFLSGLPDDALERCLEHLQAAEWLYEARLVPEVVYAFKHALIQDVATHMLLPDTLRRWHRRVAGVLEQRVPQVGEQQPERLARHYTLAAEPRRALSYWKRAGQQALERAATTEAIHHLRHGLEVAATLPDPVERRDAELSLQLLLGSAWMVSKGYASPEAEQAYARARLLCQQVEAVSQRFLALTGLRAFYFVRGQFQTAYELAQELFELAERAQEPHLLVEAHEALGRSLFHRGDLRTARAHLEQSLVFMNLSNPPSPASLHLWNAGVICQSYLSWLLWTLGYPDQARQRSREACALSERLTYPFSRAIALCFAALFQQLCRDAASAKAYADTALALSTEQGFPYWRGYALAVRGWALVKQGDVQTGIEQMHEGHAAMQATGAAVGWPLFLGYLAEAYLETGDVARADTVLADAKAAAARNGEREYDAELFRLEGEIRLQAGNDPRQAAPAAEACFQQAMHIARRQQARMLQLRAAICLGRLLLQQGKTADARHVVAPLYDGFTEGFDIADLYDARALLDLCQQDGNRPQKPTPP
ncbi:MAG: adenylate/guanylate cyclase domain-containing protein [Candidatus Tectimicrobiota bacterium]|nr:MAG: adenylate/guanylate cyclase domain-containing protein [Candidatus Tectomicrobia bacterium]